MHSLGSGYCCDLPISKYTKSSRASKLGVYKSTTVSTFGVARQRLSRGAPLLGVLE